MLDAVGCLSYKAIVIIFNNVDVKERNGFTGLVVSISLVTADWRMEEEMVSFGDKWE